MLTYKYIPNPKLGDLIAYADGCSIRPGVITGFSKQGNIQILFLIDRYLKRYIAGKPKDKKSYWYSPIKTVAKNHLDRVVLMDKASLDTEELRLYNLLIKPQV